MFDALKNIIDLLRSGISDAKISKDAKERKEIALNLLRSYFIFKDCADEGERLINEAGPDPVGKIRAMDEFTAATTLERWDGILQRQAKRLRSLEGFIYGQHHLSVINPKLQDNIGKVIGSKMERTNSLHGIGAALFFKAIFSAEKSNEERARYVAVMAGSQNDLFNMDAVHSEITQMKDSLDEYRTVIGSLLTDEEITCLSRQARNETLSEKTP